MKAAILFLVACAHAILWAVETGCICLAMAFAFGADVLNLRGRRKRKPVELRSE